jgi:hypothetical protein
MKKAAEEIYPRAVCYERLRSIPRVQCPRAPRLREQRAVLRQSAVCKRIRTGKEVPGDRRCRVGETVGVGKADARSERYRHDERRVPPTHASLRGRRSVLREIDIDSLHSQLQNARRSAAPGCSRSTPDEQKNEKKQR